MLQNQELQPSLHLFTCCITVGGGGGGEERSLTWSNLAHIKKRNSHSGAFQHVLHSRSFHKAGVIFCEEITAGGLAA